MIVCAYLRLDGAAGSSAELNVIIRLGGLADRDPAALFPSSALQVHLKAEFTKLAEKQRPDALAVLSLALSLCPSTSLIRDAPCRRDIVRVSYCAEPFA